MSRRTLNREAFCPACGMQEHRYDSIPRSRLHYTQGAAEHTEHMPVLHGYECLNCGAEWLLLLQEPTHGGAHEPG